MGGHTLSSTAQRVYWLGRYLERVGSTARLISVNANLMIDLPMRMPLGWLPLVDILAQEDLFRTLYPDVESAEPIDIERQVARFLLSDRRNPGSLLSALDFARENTRTLRGVLPRSTFEHINEAHMYTKDALAEPLSRTRRRNGLQHISERMQQIDGFLSATMLHDANWNFLRMGNFIERADMTTRIIDLRTANLLPDETHLTPFADTQWRSVVSSLDAQQSYAASTQAPINQPDVLEFLLQNRELPRSLLRCFSTIRNCLRDLPKNKPPLEQIEKMRRQLQRARVRNLDGPRLHKFIDARQKQLFTLHQKITNNYFP
ncbi:MAG: alpha-E domain-containing protein [Pseudomonadota bacterium]